MRRWFWLLAVFAAVELVLLVVFVVLLVQPAPKPTPPGPPVATALCQPDPAAQIAALPAGATFNGHGCYLTSGIVLTQPRVTLNFNGGTLEDTLTTAPIKPVIWIKGLSKTSTLDPTGDVVENLTIVGMNRAGTYHAALVGEEAINVESASFVSINHVSTLDTYGDGLTAVANLAHHAPPDVELNVNGFSVTNAGRQGITVAECRVCAFTNTDVVSSADTGWDFESDVADGSGPVTATNVSGKGVVMSEPLYGAITFTTVDLTGHIVVEGGSAKTGEPISFTGGTVEEPANDSGTPPGGVYVNGPGNLTLTDLNMPRKPTAGGKPPKGKAWVVLNGGHLTLAHCSIAPPLGVHDGTSTVTITP